MFNQENIVNNVNPHGMDTVRYFVTINEVIHR